MQTQCPNCQTQYNIDDKALAGAHGQAQCYQCDAVFNAFENGMKTEVTPVALKKIDEKIEALGLNRSHELDTEVEELLVDDSITIDHDQTIGIKKKTNHFFSSFLVIIFSITAIGQAAWLKKDALLKDASYRPYLKIACEQLNCTLPKPKALDKIKVLNRNLAPDPKRNKALSLKLTFQNQAPFSQPIPNLQLSLYDHNEILQARRQFNPDEYLFPAPKQGQNMQINESLSIDLLLDDPGPQILGFKIHFL